MIKPLLFDSTHLIIILVIDAQHNTNFPFDFIKFLTFLLLGMVLYGIS